MSSEVPIPEAAVELVVPLLTHVMTVGDAEDVAWDAVRAAAPLVVAAALDEEADRIHSTIQAWGYGPNDDPPAHSIAGALVDVAVELRERASVLRGEGQTDG